MKSLKIVAIFVLFGVLITLFPSAEGYLIPKEKIEHYLDNELILLGKVISSKEIKNSSNSSPMTSYEIQILQNIKGNTVSDKITVIGLGSINSTKQIENQTVFSKGEKPLLMLNKLTDEKWHISPYSFYFESYNPDFEFILPPLKLFRAGIAIEEIHCKSTLQLAIKSFNGVPVCLKPESKKILSDRGWIK